MINKQMKELVEQHKTIDHCFPDDVERHWAKMIEVMTVNLEWTIDYLGSAPEEQILCSSEVWDDISEFWQSPKLITAMESCIERFPNLAKDLETPIFYAKKGLKK